MIGWLIPNNLVSGVENAGFDGGMVVIRCRGLEVDGMEQAGPPDHNQAPDSCLVTSTNERCG